LATRTSSTRSGTPKCRPTGSRTFGGTDDGGAGSIAPHGRSSRSKKTTRHIVEITRPSSAVQAQDPFAPASRELTTFALVGWRSAYVPPGKAESARALPSRIRCVLRHRRKRPHKLCRINCVAATIELTGREPATFDCPVDRRFGNACGPCCAVWCVHARYQCVALKTCCYVPMQSLRPG
jgi:hypothetical protein